jgi:hypothetical protein
LSTVEPSTSPPACGGLGGVGVGGVSPLSTVELST